MENLVFRIYFMVILCWHSGIAEQSDNGYFYDIPMRTLFDESAGTVNSGGIFPPRQSGGFHQHLLSPLPKAPVQLEILPSKLVYEDTKTTIHEGLGYNGNIDIGYNQKGLENAADFSNSQHVFEGSNQGFNPIAFSVQDAGNSPQGPCNPEPIIAQYNPELVNLSNGGPLTRLITTCGPNNDCNTITLRSDVNRHLGALSSSGSSNFNTFQDGYLQKEIIQPRTINAGINAYDEPLVSPPNRRLISYSEIEQEDNLN